MKWRELIKLNGAGTCGEVKNKIMGAGFAPFAEGDIGGLTLMSIFKSRERHTPRRKKADGTFIRLHSFTSPEGAESYDFLVMNAEKKLKGRGDGNKFTPLYYYIFYKKI